jgi:hypothetical protein
MEQLKGLIAIVKDAIKNDKSLKYLYSIIAIAATIAIIDLVAGNFQENVINIIMIILIGVFITFSKSFLKNRVVKGIVNICLILLLITFTVGVTNQMIKYFTGFSIFEMLDLPTHRSTEVIPKNLEKVNTEVTKKKSFSISPFLNNKTIINTLTRTFSYSIKEPNRADFNIEIKYSLDGIYQTNVDRYSYNGGIVEIYINNNLCKKLKNIRIGPLHEIGFEKQRMFEELNKKIQFTVNHNEEVILNEIITCLKDTLFMH